MLAQSYSISMAEDSTFYTHWRAMFENYIGPHKVYLWNNGANVDEPMYCTLECAVAYLESFGSDFDFRPENVRIKRGLLRKISKKTSAGIKNYELYDENYRYAEYEGAPIANREDGKYLIFFRIYDSGIVQLD